MNSVFFGCLGILCRLRWSDSESRQKFRVFYVVCSGVTANEDKNVPDINEGRVTVRGATVREYIELAFLPL